MDKIRTSDIGNEGWFSNKASNKAKQLEKERIDATNLLYSHFADAE
jgi:hypothetical protein